jgi:hypothetical protein
MLELKYTQKSVMSGSERRRCFIPSIVFYFFFYFLLPLDSLWRGVLGHMITHLGGKGIEIVHFSVQGFGLPKGLFFSFSSLLFFDRIHVLI